MQIPTEYGEDYIVLAVSVGLATIGVCVFGAVASVAALFVLERRKKEGEIGNYIICDLKAKILVQKRSKL